MFYPLIIAFVLAFAMTLAGVPLAGYFARRLGLVDKPDQNRKLHREPIPLVGGVVVFFVTVAVSFFVIYFFDLQIYGSDARELLVLLAASLVILLVGVVDDRFNIRGRQKLFGQIVAVTILILGGYQFEQIQFAGFVVPFGIFSALIVYFWCLAAINSVNLLDGADGFASTVGIITCGSLAAMAIHYEFYIDAVILIAMASALLGFLRFNFPPAKAYLGDAGSMLIGLIIAAIAIRCTFKQGVAYAVFAPVALLAIPLIDTSAAVIRRRFTGRSIYMEDRGHLHHIMARNGLSPVASLIWVAALCLMSAMGGALSIITSQAEYAVASIFMVLAVMIFGKVFAVAEFNLVSRKVKGVVRSMLMMRSSREQDNIQQSGVQLQGQRDWKEMWTRLREFAAECELNDIMLDVNAPWLHESYHAEWKRKGVGGGMSNQWRVEIPMIVDGKVFARVVVHAPRLGRYTHHEVVGNLMKITADLESACAGMGSAITNPSANSRSGSEQDDVTLPAGSGRNLH